MLAINSKQPELFFEKCMSHVPILLEQKEQLDALAEIINTHLHTSTISLNFIDEDNSILSQLTQVWGTYASKFFKINNLICQSAGLKSSSIANPVLKSLKNIGFDIKLIEFNHHNSVYAVQDWKYKSHSIVYSKQIDELKQSPIAVDIDLILNEMDSFTSHNTYQLKFKFPKAYDARSRKNIHFLNLVISAHIYYLFESLSNS